MMSRKITLWFLAAVFIFQACEKEEIVVPEGEAPVADAGPDVNARINSKVVLDGSASSDPDGDDLEFSWQITAAPSESESRIDDPSSDNTFFRPDVAGNYVVRLSVTDGQHPPQTDEITVTVADEVAPTETVVISGDISENTIWEDIFDDPLTPDYLVSRSIAVRAKLEVKPGVIVHFKDEAIMTVETGGGTLIAEGTADNKITFTSTDEAGEVKWGGIYIKSTSSQNSINFADIRYAGGKSLFSISFTQRFANLGVAEKAKLSLRNTHISKSGSEGLFVVGNGNFIEFENNTFYDNTGYPIAMSINQLGIIDPTNQFLIENANGKEKTVMVYDSELEVAQEWYPMHEGGKLLFTGNTTINAALTIHGGVNMEFNESVSLTVSDKGTLVAKGTEDNKVIFTSSNITDGKKWGGLLVNSTSVNNHLDHVQISHAGGAELISHNFIKYPTNIAVSNEARLKLTNTEISHSAGNGLFMGKDAILGEFSNNHFHHNTSYPLYFAANIVGMMDGSTTIEDNSTDVVAVYESKLNAQAHFSGNDPIWHSLDGEAKYLFTGDIVVERDLIIEKGAYLTFDEDVKFIVAKGASLKAIGTAADKIILTSISRDGNRNWGGLLYQSENTNNSLEFVEVSYAGSIRLMAIKFVHMFANVAVDAGASLQVKDVLIRDSKNYGMVLAPSAEMVDKGGLTFQNNKGDNIFDGASE